MTSGIIDLTKLYELNKASGQFEILDTKSEAGKRFKKIKAGITTDISEKPGFYLWGNFNRDRFWTNIYLGKAGTGKITSLKYRITDELGEERAFIIQGKMTDDLDGFCRKIFPKKWDESYKKVYDRAVRKHKANYIVWAEFDTNGNENIEEVENDLIETINPEANRKRATPPTNLREETIRILREFRHQIHEQRDRF